MNTLAWLVWIVAVVIAYYVGHQNGWDEREQLYKDNHP